MTSLVNYNSCPDPPGLYYDHTVVQVASLDYCNSGIDPPGSAGVIVQVASLAHWNSGPDPPGLCYDHSSCG